MAEDRAWHQHQALSVQKEWIQRNCGSMHRAAGCLLRGMCCYGDGIRHSYLGEDGRDGLHVHATMLLKSFCRSHGEQLALLADQPCGRRQIAKATLGSQRASSTRPDAAACTLNDSTTLETPIASATASQRGAKTSSGLFQQSVCSEGNQSRGVASRHACHREIVAGCEQQRR